MAFDTPWRLLLRAQGWTSPNVAVRLLLSRVDIFIFHREIVKFLFNLPNKEHIIILQPRITSEGRTLTLMDSS